MRGSAELSYINFFRRFYRRTFRRWLRPWFWRKHRHVTVRICHLKSLGDSVGNLNGEPVTSLYGHCTGSRFWIRRWFRQKKKTAKTPTSATRLFLNSDTFPSVIQSVKPLVFSEFLVVYSLNIYDLIINCVSCVLILSILF